MFSRVRKWMEIEAVEIVRGEYCYSRSFANKNKDRK